MTIPTFQEMQFWQAFKTSKGREWTVILESWRRERRTHLRKVPESVICKRLFLPCKDFYPSRHQGGLSFSSGQIWHCMQGRDGQWSVMNAWWPCVGHERRRALADPAEEGCESHLLITNSLLVVSWVTVAKQTKFQMRVRRSRDRFIGFLTSQFFGECC